MLQILSSHSIWLLVLSNTRNKMHKCANAVHIHIPMSFIHEQSSKYNIRHVIIQPGPNIPIPCPHFHHIFTNNQSKFNT